LAITLCKRHGRSHFTEVCPHVANSVDAGSYGSFHRIALIPSGLLVCGECLDKYGLAEFVNHPGLRIGQGIWDSELEDDAYEAYSKAYERFTDRSIRCDACIAAAEATQTQRDRRPT